MKKINWNWLAIIIGMVAFLAIISNLNGAADREAEAAQAARDSIRVIVVADSVLRVQDLERFEENLALAREDARVEREARQAAERNRRVASAQRDSLDSIVDASQTQPRWSLGNCTTAHAWLLIELRLR